MGASQINAMTLAPNPPDPFNAKACLIACDDDPDCAAVWMTRTGSSATLSTTTWGDGYSLRSCFLIKGDTTLGVYKRSVTRTIVQPNAPDKSTHPNSFTGARS